MPNIVDGNTTGDPVEFNRLVARTVRTMRKSLDVTVADLAKASGVPCSSIETIELGNASTRSDRHDIAVAVAWLSNNGVARRLTAPQREVPRVDPA